MSNYSTDGTEEVLKDTCGDKLTFERYTGRQLDKRQRYFDIAGELKCDVLIVVDSDDYLHPDYAEWAWFNVQLEKMVATGGTATGYMWFWIPNATIWPRQHNAVESDLWYKYVRVHTNPGEQQYVLTHWCFTTKEILDKVSEKDIALYHLKDWSGAPLPSGEEAKGNPYLLQPSYQMEGIRFTTDRVFRTPEQLEHGDGWAFQETNEDNCRIYTYWCETQPQLRVLDLSEPHYFDESGKIVWYNGEPKYLPRKEITFASFL